MESTVVAAQDAGVQTKSMEQRKALLAQAVNSEVIRGARVESQSDYQAVLVKGKPVNHVLHLILTFVTFFTWSLVWLGLVIFGGEKRYTVTIDDYGNTNIQR